MEYKNNTVMHGEDWDIARIKEEPLNPDEITTESQTSYVQQHEMHFVKCNQSSDVDTKVGILKETWDQNVASCNIKTDPKQSVTCLGSGTIKHEDEINNKELAIQVKASPESPRLHLQQNEMYLLEYNVSSVVETNEGIKEEVWDPNGASSDVLFSGADPIKISAEIDTKDEVWCCQETAAASFKEGEEDVLSKKVMAESIPLSESPRLSAEASKLNSLRSGFIKIFPNDGNSYSFTSNCFDKDLRTIKEDKPHKCSICDISYTQLRYLKRHKLIHEGIKSHICDVCNKNFAHQGHLKTHKLIHEGKKPHKCDVCEKSFTQVGSLNKHKLIHEGKRPYKCGVCDKSFTQAGSLKTHTLIHEGKKPHKCNVCDKSFTRLGDLKAHTLIHEGKKPHKCGVCDKSFTQLGNLKAHNLIHGDKKPHKCDICDKSFTIRGKLKRHKLIHEKTQTPKMWCLS